MLHQYRLIHINNPPSTLQRDQLVCFGVELMEYLFAKNDVQLMVVSEGATANAETHTMLEDVVDPVQELADDLITVTSFFVAHHNILCSAAHQQVCTVA